MTWLDPDWRQFHKLWSIRIAVFWAVVCGCWAALPAFQSYVTPVEFGLLCIGFSLAIMAARVTNQPGVTL